MGKISYPHQQKNDPHDDGRQAGHFSDLLVPRKEADESQGEHVEAGAYKESDEQKDPAQRIGALENIGRSQQKRRAGIDAGQKAKEWWHPGAVCLHKAA